MRAVEHPDEQAPDDIAAIGGPGVVERGRIDAIGPQAAQIMGEQRTFPASPVDEVESGDQKIAYVDRPGAEPRLRIEENRRSGSVDIEVAEENGRGPGRERVCQYV